MATLIRLLSSPLLQVAGLVFDVELGVGRGQRRDYTRRRVAAGIDLSDNSRLVAREWSLEGAVSAVLQPQNLTRPGQNLLAALSASGAGVAAQFDGSVATQLDNFEDNLVALMEVGDVVDVVSKAPGTGSRRFRAVVEEWHAQSTADGPESGDAAVYRLSLREVQRAGGLGLGSATPEALGLNGTATPTNLGPTPSPASQVDMVP